MGIRKKSNEINDLEFFESVFFAVHGDAFEKAQRPFLCISQEGKSEFLQKTARCRRRYAR